MDHKIYAVYDEDVIRVYQAYNDIIADEAVQRGTFGNSFKLERMTWVKPSFLWMMYRSGWGTKDGQNRILAIDIKRTGFDYLVKNAVLSTFSAEIHGTYEHWKAQLSDSKIRCQWDPERDIYGNPQNQRTIQLGFKGSVSKKYTLDWIVKISDITQEVGVMKKAIEQKMFEHKLLPLEKEYLMEQVR